MATTFVAKLPRKIAYNLITSNKSREEMCSEAMQGKGNHEVITIENKD